MLIGKGLLEKYLRVSFAPKLCCFMTKKMHQIAKVAVKIVVILLQLYYI